ncbi:MAG: hypothetical protein AAF612_11230, partial [Planctomycetota bacterium]
MPRKRRLWREALRDRSLFWSVGFAGVLAVFGAVVAGLGQRAGERHDEGQILLEPSFARVEFNLLNQAEVDFERNRARSAQPEVYTPNQAFRDRLYTALIEAADLAVQAPDAAAERYREYDFAGTALVAIARAHNATDPSEAWAPRVSLFLDRVF